MDAGAGTVKALHPFCKFGGRHSTFLEVHLAKSRRIGRIGGVALPHIFTTSYISHQPTEAFLAREKFYGYSGPVLLSEGRTVGLRLIPMERDLLSWEEMPQQMLDEQQQKVRDSLRHALIGWAQQAGEAAITLTTCRSNACIRSATGSRFPTYFATERWRACWNSGPT